MKRSSLARLAGASLFLCLTASSVPAFADALLDAGKLLKKGQYPAAMKEVDAWLAKHPKDAQGRFLKGLILTKENKQEEAIKVFQGLTADYPRLPEPYNNLAVIYASQGKYEKARDALEAAIQTHPSYATAHENLGDIYAKLASQAYDKALQLDKSNSNVETKLELITALFSREQPLTKHVASSEAAKAVLAEKPAESEARPEAKPEAKPEEKTQQKAETRPETKPADGEVNEAKAVVEAIEAWAKAWSDQDVKAYLSHYADDFEPSDGKGLAHWKALRKARIERPKFISVKISDPEVTLKSGKHATIRFRQSYESSSMKETAVKVVSLSKTDGKWLIENEEVGN